ncbi:class I SAM-dependent methyltransferase [Legionella israelensis]|uniref:Class I SAM-dependent methyltransferase n=1 Tax=Legionella israelensis TaxID=454 RepID=A0AAX1EDR9_9GAMM|nr:class I SAM-dependent methyltransferase [Legionella israelensis]QBR83261.1 class I SAM-dependent methyltransferase [Legionella israelensis]
MNKDKWCAQKYSKGSFIQSHLNDLILPKIENILPGNHILDVGCGQGEYTCKLANKFSNCSFTAIDSSKNMIEYAKTHNLHPNISYLQADVHSELKLGPFDNILSFWCLHWTDIKLATQQLYRVLKKEGEIFALFYSSYEGTLPNAITSLYSLDEYPNIQAFAKRAIEKRQAVKIFIETRLKQLPFSDYSFSRQRLQIKLPSLDILKAFFKAVPYMRQIDENTSEIMLEHMLKYFLHESESQFGGEYIYYTTPYILNIRKLNSD